MNYGQWTRVDENNSVRFKLTFMGNASYRWYRRETNDEREIEIRYLEPDDYERSITTRGVVIPPVGTITCIDETIPSNVIDAISVDTVHEHFPRIAGYRTILSA